jgi:hypothetical protein
VSLRKVACCFWPLEGLPMKAIDSPFTKIINGTTQFVIPVFQRDYTWDAETQCAQLWRDVLHSAGTGNERGHFFGSIVYVATGDSLAGLGGGCLLTDSFGNVTEYYAARSIRRGSTRIRSIGKYSPTASMCSADASESKTPARSATLRRSL